LGSRLIDAEVSIVSGRVWATSEYVDFTVKPHDMCSGTWTVCCVATVREPAPGLGTWWTDWCMRNVTLDELISELTRARETIERILLSTEHGGYSNRFPHW
jgi:hypothetical protein